MLISETAFYLLGTTPDANRQSLLDIVERLRLKGEEEIIRESYRNLTLSNKRLIHELSWMIGVADGIDIHSLIETARLGELNILNANHLLTNAPLAFCNLVTENIHASLLNKKTNMVALNELLTLFAQAYERIDTTLILNQINSSRGKAKFPLIHEASDIDAALQGNLRAYIATFQELHKSLPTTQFVRGLTQAIERVTASGTKQNYVFLEELVAIYKINVTEKLSLKVSAVKKILNDILLLLKKDSEQNKELLDSAIDVLRKNMTSWDTLVQPIQLTHKSQGKEDRDSVGLAKEVRKVALAAFNEYSRPDVSIKICEILAGVFAEVPAVKAIIDDDQEFLSKQIVEIDEHLEKVLNKCLHVSLLKNSPEEALKEVEECISMAKKELLNTDNADKFNELLVNILRELAICISNEKREYLAALAILNESLDFAKNKEQKDNIEKNIGIIQRNLFGSLAG